ncbi:hypothetical protein GcC1_212010 [Golovinomyces cichoracearum]|uniref:Uncharacterized protein n=1 Tax=Golovinomyces cichoracearum TaxID=62708 RepID=A0A420HAB3_9PEZI|nr:hypothetical protein GcC1_212010 [Golovinomyces cichoracearum]
MDVLTTRLSRPALGKRKAEYPENNERLSKRLSLLKLEHEGVKFCVPSETAISQHPSPAQPPINYAASTAPSNELMQIEDSKHKVYIYDLDAEILESEPEESKLILHPDIEKCLRDCRHIPPPIIANANHREDNQLVLYNVPGSLTVPEDQDCVRRAIIETRARARAKQESFQRSCHDFPLNMAQPSVSLEPISSSQLLSQFDKTINDQQPQIGDMDVMEIDVL